MKISILIVLMSLCIIASGQFHKDDWQYDIQWQIPAGSADSLSSLIVDLTTVWKPDSVEMIWLEVSDLPGSIVYSDSINVSSNCFPAAGGPCSIPVIPVKSGIYRFDAKLIYKDKSVTVQKTIDQTAPLKK